MLKVFIILFFSSMLIANNKIDINNCKISDLERIPLDQTKIDLLWSFLSSNRIQAITEAEYQGRKVKLNDPIRGGSKKFYVYVKDGDKVKKVSFGSSGLRAKINNRGAVKSFVARHKCKQKNDKTKPGYCSCRLPRYAKSLGLSGGGGQWW